MSRAQEIHRARGPIYALTMQDGAVHCGCGDGTVLTWSVDNPTRIALTAQLPHAVFSACALDDGVLALGTSAGELFLIHLHERRAMQRIEAHTGAIHAIEQLGHARIATASADGHLRTWCLEAGRWAMERDLALAEGKLRALSASRNGSLLAVACGDGAVRVLESELLNETRTFNGHAGGATAVSFHPTKPVLLSGSKDGHLRAWPLDGPAAELIALPAHRAAIYSIAFDDKGAHFTTASRDKTLKLWDATSLDVIERLDARDGGHLHSVNAAVWLDHSLITSGDDRRLLRWDQNG